MLVQGLLQWRHVVLGDRAELAPHSHLGWTDTVRGVTSILLWIVRFGNPTAALGQHTPRLGQPTFEFNFLALSHSPLQKSGRTYSYLYLLSFEPSNSDYVLYERNQPRDQAQRLDSGTDP